MRYEKEVDELRERFKRAKQGLMDSVDFETWERVKDTGEQVIDICERVVDTGELAALAIPLSIPDCAH